MKSHALRVVQHGELLMGDTYFEAVIQWRRGSDGRHILWDSYPLGERFWWETHTERKLSSGGEVLMGDTYFEKVIQWGRGSDGRHILWESYPLGKVLMTNLPWEVLMGDTYPERVVLWWGDHERFWWETPTLRELSGDEVTIRGSDGRHWSPVTAPLWASLIWLCSFRSSRFHTAMCPIELPVTMMGWPSYANTKNTTLSGLSTSHKEYEGEMCWIGHFQNLNPNCGDKSFQILQSLCWKNVSTAKYILNVK